MRVKRFRIVNESKIIITTVKLLFLILQPFYARSLITQILYYRKNQLLNFLLLYIGQIIFHLTLFKGSYFKILMFNCISFNNKIILIKCTMFQIIIFICKLFRYHRIHLLTVTHTAQLQQSMHRPRPNNRHSNTHRTCFRQPTNSKYKTNITFISHGQNRSLFIRSRIGHVLSFEYEPIRPSNGGFCVFPRLTSFGQLHLTCRVHFSASPRFAS